MLHIALPSVIALLSIPLNILQLVDVVACSAGQKINKECPDGGNYTVKTTKRKLSRERTYAPKPQLTFWYICITHTCRGLITVSESMFLPPQASSHIKGFAAMVQLMQTASLHLWILVMLTQQKKRIELWKIKGLSLMRMATVKRRVRATTRAPSCDNTTLQTTDSGLSVWTAPMKTAAYQLWTHSALCRPELCTTGPVLYSTVQEQGCPNVQPTINFMGANDWHTALFSVRLCSIRCEALVSFNLFIHNYWKQFQFACSVRRLEMFS